MKIEVGFAELNRVLEKMGIEELVEGPSSDGWDPIDIVLTGRGIDLVDPSQITVDDDGTLSYEGRKILVYIRDQYISYGGYKFHVANCSTIQQMKKWNRFETRYVASTRTDGKFLVNIIDFDEIIESEEKLIEMSVCKNCLRHLNYKNYDRNRKKVFDEFSLEEFFNIYSETTVSKPPHTNRNAPLNVYQPDQSEHSHQCRERAGWRCQGCEILLEGEAGKFLHTHHINGDKTNNNPSNLRALCVDCHNEQAQHSLQVREFREYKRKRWPNQTAPAPAPEDSEKSYFILKR